jgi:hypothetical protein
MSIELQSEDLEHLKIKCTTTLCNQDLHCFLRTRKEAQKAGGGPCRNCKIDPVDWARVALRNLSDIEYTIDMLQKETIRTKFWRKPIGSDLIANARKLGRSGLRIEVRRILNRTIASKPKGTPWDSRQTPFEGNVIYFAQHATATCCRRCAQEWHGIPNDRALAPPELDYLVELVMQYLERRAPDLPDGETNEVGSAA